MNNKTLTVSEIINIIQTFVEKNPNNFTKEEIDYLTEIEAQTLDIRNLLLFEKNNANESLLIQLKDGLKDMTKLLHIIEELDTSYICRPVNGLVIHRDRVKFGKILNTLKEKYKKKATSI